MLFSQRVVALLAHGLVVEQVLVVGELPILVHLGVGARTDAPQESWKSKCQACVDTTALGMPSVWPSA